ncbi:MAG: transcription antitermination factor NusB [Gammaproteobacteria bacterium]|nr:transcription antitermination factor NusB [Gammaproteobacteria bacterium]
MNQKERHRARRMIVQALYEREISQNESQQIIADFLINNSQLKFDRSYFQTSFINILDSMIDLDNLFIKYIKRDLKELDPVTRAILRLASFELKDKLDVPYKVIINEAIDIAKIFGAEDSYKFINGSLDKLAKELRPNG